MLETILEDHGYHVDVYGKFQADLFRYDRRSNWEVQFFMNNEVVDVINRAVKV